MKYDTIHIADQAFFYEIIEIYTFYSIRERWTIFFTHTEIAFERSKWWKAKRAVTKPIELFSITCPIDSLSYTKEEMREKVYNAYESYVLKKIKLEKRTHELEQGVLI